MQVIVDSLLTSYDSFGDGPVVLFLHGWGDNRAGLKPLAQKLKSYQSVLLDLPGFGQTQTPAKAWGLDDYAKFVGDFLAKTGLQPVAIVGHSNGGAIAVRGLANKSLKTNKLILLASAGIRDEQKGRKRALKLLAKGAKVVTAPLPAQLKRRIKVKAYQKVGSEMFVAEHLEATFRKIVADDILQDAPQVNLSTLLIYGSNDQSTPVEYGKKLEAALPKAYLKVVPNAGHFVHLDAPDQVESYVREFLT